MRKHMLVSAVFSISNLHIRIKLVFLKIYIFIEHN